MKKLSQTSKGSRQRGITLVESLVSLVILALGVLGLLGFQMQTLRDTRDSVGRSRAIVAIQDIAERMRVNPYALANYTATFAAVAAPGTDCMAVTCNVTQLATFDIWRWKANVAAALPGGQAAIQRAPAAGDQRQFAVMIGWLENTSDANAADAAARNVTKATAATSGTTALVCPAGLTCHLVYVVPFH